jgi:hypothetical protein
MKNLGNVEFRGHQASHMNIAFVVLLFVKSAHFRSNCRQDVSIIYAEPAKEDLKNLLRDKNLLDIVQVGQ